MKWKTLYVCEYCGKESLDFGEIEACEASCLGVSIDKLHWYRDAQLRARQWAAILSRENNQENRDAEERVIREIMDFEKQYNIRED